MIELGNNILIVDDQELGEILDNKRLEISINTRPMKERLMREISDHHDKDTRWVLTAYSWDPEDEYNFKVITDFQKTSVVGVEYYLENREILKDIKEWMDSIKYDNKFANKVNNIYHNILAQMFSDCTRYIKELLNLIP